MTRPAVRSVPRHPQRSVPQNREKTKYVKKGLDEGPRLRIWKTAQTAMSPRWVMMSQGPDSARFQAKNASPMA